MDPDSAPTWARRLTDLGGALHRHFLKVLLVCYALAAFFPAPGLWLRQATVVLPTGDAQHLPMLLLALLLFCAAFSVSWHQVRDVVDRPGVIVAALVTVWLGPALAVAVLAGLTQRIAAPEATAGLLVGLALVAAMPVANSSAGWSQSAGGNVALSLGMVVLSIVLSPLATPQALKLMGWALSQTDTEKIERVVREFSGWRFIAWVILPSLAGAATAWCVGAARVAAAKPWIRLVTLVDLLLLNYANAALALPKVVHDERWQITLAAGAIALSVSLLGIVLAMGLARLLHTSHSSYASLLFGLSMKHTGLALVLAGEVLADHPRVILVIVLATLMQHVVAAAADAQFTRARESQEGADVATPH